MPYSAEISQRNPTYFLFLVDQSGSMSRPFGGDSRKRKADGVADAINRLLQELVLRCSMGPKILDRYFVGLLGYNDSVNLGFGGALAGRHQVKISEVAANPLRTDERVRKQVDDTGSIYEERTQFQVWLDGVASGKTKMCEALAAARESVADFIRTYPKCFPPMVINLTDGIPTDGTLEHAEAAAVALRSVASEDGEALLFNIHISEVAAAPILYPADERQLPDEYSRCLFRMSSPFPQRLYELANAAESEVRPDSRGFVFQGDLLSVVQFLDIGTRVGRNV